MKAIAERKKRYILRHSEELSKRQLAKEMKVSRSTVYRILRDLKIFPLYQLPKPMKCGRKHHIFTVEELEKIIEYRQKYKVNCNTLEKLLLKYEDLVLSHNQSIILSENNLK